MTSLALSLPGVQDVTHGFSSLFGSDIPVSEAAAPMSADDLCVVAEYVDAEGTPRFFLGADFALANSLGAALTMIPPNLVKESVEGRTVPDNIGENLQEVMNVCTSLFANQMQNHRLVLHATHYLNAPPDDLAARMQGAISRSDYHISVPRYQDGILTAYGLKAG